MYLHICHTNPSCCRLLVFLLVVFGKGLDEIFYANHLKILQKIKVHRSVSIRDHTVYLSATSRVRELAILMSAYSCIIALWVGTVACMCRSGIASGSCWSTLPTYSDSLRPTPVLNCRTTSLNSFTCSSLLTFSSDQSLSLASRISAASPATTLSQTTLSASTSHCCGPRSSACRRQLYWHFSWIISSRLPPLVAVLVITHPRSGPFRW